jgi:hypothetical protein
MLSQSEIDVLPLMDMSYLDFLRVERLPSDEQQEALQELKVQAKKGYRKAVGVLHPDHNGGDPRKTARFREVVALYEKIKRMELGVVEEEEYYEEVVWNPTPVYQSEVRTYQEVDQRFTRDGEPFFDGEVVVIFSFTFYG